MTKPILPGQTIGILGGGQLGRMLAMVARRTGYRVHIFSPESDVPAGHFAQQITRADYQDRDALLRFVDQVDVITFEFENVPTQPLTWIDDRRPIRPSPRVFETVQNRIAEKQFLAGAGIPCAPFRIIPNWESLRDAVRQIPLPSVLKSSGGGYDGKGQTVIRQVSDAELAWRQIGEQPATLERFIDLQSELSVLVARDIRGRIDFFGPIENRHVNHILDVSVAPAQLPIYTLGSALDIAAEIAEQFDLVGLICIEYFLATDGTLLVNEIAPRPHNSGHLTIEAAVTSQFEQQLRAVCGLPLGVFEQRLPAAMANLLGDLWQSGTPQWQAVADFPSTYLHLYDKSEPRKGRKMGHLTTCADDPAKALDIVTRAREAL
ncbi:MAG TPA: 5-(carboxyamino)imidazole ribonucleotide synthase [Pirellulaceae bacterium]|nr:5-(carboxyamino)imidazole ribonucleotide synthase [Pirellulaceae bacterium]